MSAFTRVRLRRRRSCLAGVGMQPALPRDYRDMGMMIFGEIPNFDTVLNILQRLEDEINGN
jgi:hypothetical protein